MKGVGFLEMQALRRLEELAHELGFELGPCQYDIKRGFGLCPRDDEMPTYNREAMLWTGDMEDIHSFLKGIEFAKTYYMQHLKLFNASKLARKEQDVRNQYLADVLKQQEDENEK